MKRRQSIDETQWHLDKRVPIALIVSIAMQTGGIVWWGATTNARINSLEQKVEMVAPQGDRLTRVEVKVDNMIDGLSEIKSLLRRETMTRTR